MAHLLTHEASRADELDVVYKKKAALSGPNAVRLLLSERMLRAPRAEMRAATGHLATLSEIAILVEEVIRPDVVGNDAAQLMCKAAALSRSTKK